MLKPRSIRYFFFLLAANFPLGVDLLVALPFLCCAGAGAGGVAVLLLLDLVILTSSGVSIFLLRVAGCMSGGVYRAAPTCLPNPLSGCNHPGPIFFISVLRSDSSVLLLPSGGLFCLDGAGLSTGEGVFRLDAAFLSSGGVFRLDAAACCFLSHHTQYARSLDEEEEEDSKPEEDILSLYESSPDLEDTGYCMRLLTGCLRGFDDFDKSVPKSYFYFSLPASSVKLRGLWCLPDPKVVE